MLSVVLGVHLRWQVAAVALGDPSVVAVMAGHCVFAEVAVHSPMAYLVLPEWAGHYPMTYRASLARSMAAVCVPRLLAHRCPRMIRNMMKKRNCGA